MTKETLKSTRSRKIVLGQSAAWIALAIMGIFTLFPFFITFILALSVEGEPTLPHALPRSLTLDNITRALSSRDLVTWIINSVTYSLVSTVAVLLLCSMAGYAFAKKPFPGSNILMWCFLATLMVPAHVTLIPLFATVSKLGGINTMWGLIIPTIANSQAVFLMRQFIAGIPDELLESARMDGAGELRIFFQMILPLSKPVLATVGIFVFLWHWNDFLWPLVVAQSSKARTLTVGLASMGTESASLASTMASAAITVIPCLIIFFMLQRYLIRGITAGALKG